MWISLSLSLLECIKLLESLGFCLSPYLGNFQLLCLQIICSILYFLLIFWDSCNMNVRHLVLSQVSLFSPLFSLFLRLHTFFWFIFKFTISSFIFTDRIQWGFRLFIYLGFFFLLAYFCRVWVIIALVLKFPFGTSLYLLVFCLDFLYICFKSVHPYLFEHLYNSYLTVFAR